ncbi:MAG: branched-chain-amino-acid transaminase [Planctomycetes bacterium]|nr:branched-chain-amino-acid transaminase [Planctomycetota bacterium]
MSTSSESGPAVYIDGKFMGPDQAMISVYDHGFLYGDGIFEGIRMYGGKVFKLMSHLERLFGGAAEIRLKPALDRAQMAQAVRDTVARSGLKDGYIRLIASRGKGSLGLNPNHCPTSSTIIIVDRIHLYPEKMYEQGMPIVVAKRPRIPAVCLDPAIKSLNYLNNILAKVEALDAGVHEAIMLNMAGEVSECTGDNIFAVKKGVLYTPPVTAGILRGVTRRFVIDTLAPAAGLQVKEGPLKLGDVLSADEVFLTGTAAEIIGVSKIDATVIGGGGVGPITKKLAADFKNRVKNNAPED